MKEISFFKELLNLANLVLHNKLYLTVFICTIIISMILLEINKKKIYQKKIFAIMYLIILSIIVYLNRTNIYKMFDYMMNNIFVSIYFPNLAIYMLALIITNIIMIVTISTRKTNILIRKINIIIYSIITFLFIILLNIIKENKLNIYDKISIYSNKDCITVIEISSVIFILWIIYLIIYKVIRYFIRPKHSNIVSVRKNIAMQKNNAKKYVKIDPPKVVRSEGNKKTNNLTYKDNNIIKEYEKLLTLDDYKLLLNILKEEKVKKQQEQERKKLREIEENKFEELEKMYRSVN